MDEIDRDRTEPEEQPGGNRLLVRTWNDGEAMMVRQLLETYGIPCQVVSDVPHSVLPLTVDGLGEIRILVPAERLREARARLAEHRRHGLELIAGGLGDDDEEGEDVA